MSLYSIPLTTLAGEATTLAPWQGNVLLVVNVASQCGLTPQYAALEALQRQYQARGFSVLGFPCNQFLQQEPGSAEEIQAYCRTTWDVTFSLFSKIAVNGPDRHPLYQWLTAAAPQAEAPAGSAFYQRRVDKGQAPQAPGDILWNFEKFLIGRDGRVLARFSPDMAPDDAVVLRQLEQALG
ncbi:glutathione peroxidase [Pantoea sp. 1.19]|uniref:glutathione peroxidase n=1 Tax=Pantoea sp. 1.19 TaxID=1925589 RepID=UPI000948F833|nr:glutathione peroxidase [Pantoea sp. 1.19]